MAKVHYVCVRLFRNSNVRAYYTSVLETYHYNTWNYALSVYLDGCLLVWLTSYRKYEYGICYLLFETQHVFSTLHSPPTWGLGFD